MFEYSSWKTEKPESGSSDSQASTAKTTKAQTQTSAGRRSDTTKGLRLRSLQLVQARIVQIFARWTSLPHQASIRRFSFSGFYISFQGISEWPQYSETSQAEGQTSANTSRKEATTATVLHFETSNELETNKGIVVKNAKNWEGTGMMDRGNDSEQYWGTLKAMRGPNSP